MRVVNFTPYPYLPFLWTEKDGAEHVSVIVKVTAQQQRPGAYSGGASIARADEERAPSDVAPRRTGTSVIVHGDARGAEVRVRTGALDYMGSGAGFLPALDERRARLAGTFDETWKRTRAPLLPVDYDHAYFDVAQPGLVARPFLRGGEPIELDGFDLIGEGLRTVPRVLLRLRVGSEPGAEPHLDLLQLFPSTGQCTLTFRHTFDVSSFGDELPPVTILELRKLARHSDVRS